MLYDESIRVPLVIKLPGNLAEGHRVAQPVQYIDLVPTILDLIGAPCAADYAAHGAPMIAASRLTRQFDNRVVVEDVSFEIGPGEIFGLLWPQSRWQEHHAPDACRPHLADVRQHHDRRPASRSRHRWSRARACRFLTAVPDLWERLTARSNLLSYAKLDRLPDPQPRVEALLHQFQLWDRRDDRVAQFSKGMRSSR